MVVGELAEGADLVILGAGPGGYTAALAAAAQGRSVTLIDRAGAEGVGGVCLLEGCIPSKAMIELANARHDHAHHTVMGLGTSRPPKVDLARFQGWKESVVKNLGDGVRSRLDRAGVSIVRGSAVFTGPRLLRIERPGQQSSVLEFNHALIATGSIPMTIQAIDRNDPRVVDAAGVLDLAALPERIVVLGGGYIGVELGTALQKLGARVTLIEATDRLLPGMDAQLGTDVAKGMSQLGCDVRTQTTAIGLDHVGVVCSRGQQEETIAADLVVVAIGRRPATSGIGLDAGRIQTSGSGHIKVNAGRMATDRIAAVGDAVEGPGLAHKASAESLVAVESLAGRQSAFNQLVPLVVFADPEIASVGLTLTEATAAGYEAQAVSQPLPYVGKAHVMGKSIGSARLVYDGDSGLLLGAMLSGPNATELISEVTFAIESGMLIGDLAATIHPHPTLSELIGEAAMKAMPTA